MTLTEKEARQALLLISNQTQSIIDSGSTHGVFWEGRPVILLTMRGAKSGEIRKTPVMRVEHEGTYAVVGSKGGYPRDPVWCDNLRAHSAVEILDGTESSRRTARELSGDERALWWNRAAEAFPSYNTYKEIAGRVIPVFVLELTT